MSAMLLIEMGNSAWKLAQWQPHGTFKFLQKGYDISVLEQWLRTHVRPESYQAAALACVGSEANIIRLQQFFQDEPATQGIPLQVARTTEGYGITHVYAQPETLGVDRWLTLLAAKAAHTAAIIIDAGTAITLDAISQDGRHYGGWIAPGLRLMQEALVQRSNRLKMLPADTTVDSVETLGTATETAIWLGCKASLQGFTEQAIATAKQALGEHPPIAIWCTGGDMAHINMAAYPGAEQRPHLVLEGLAQWLANSPTR